MILIICLLLLNNCNFSFGFSSENTSDKTKAKLTWGRNPDMMTDNNDRYEESETLLCPSRKRLYFLVTSVSTHISKNNGLLSPKNVTRCAIRSACYLNPDLIIEVMTVDLDEIIDDINWIKRAKHGCPLNLVVTKLNITDVLDNTPLSVLYNKTKPVNLFQGYSANNIGNAIRLALLYKFGGFYLDLDVISLRALRNIPCNSFASQFENSANAYSGRNSRTKSAYMTVNNAFMSFRNHSQFIEIAMGKFVKEFDPHRWGFQGPNLLKRTIRTIMNKKISPRSQNKEIEFNNSNLDVSILHKDSFYPLGIDVNKQIRPFFTVAASSSFKSEGYGSHTVGVHLWNHHSQPWLAKGHSGEKGGWVLHPDSVGVTLLKSCLADDNDYNSTNDTKWKAFQHPFFSKDVGTTDVLQYLR